MGVELREITAATVRSICGLEVADEQRAYVAPVAVSIAQAHFEPTSMFRAVYADDEPVGFILWRSEERPKSAYLWRFMIDRQHQGKGYARAAIERACTERRALGFDKVTTSIVRGQHSPLGFYLSVGFTEANETTRSGEWVLRKTL
ncbi:GNAT family N-acetyltransferase [Bosea sp. BIWAKO-01]|uniref:GNAT family N-acetyltransferase n=1 Tax=Bosea sp. BIWAKO-01 TaxID=506668 RepID=UPI0008538F0C|nr:GNAT family N-acetyltransferase [Bosea sp. BIWAKO-01]GAU86572.1 acetyltransferase [Bosea sp. BIWAKO-01]